MPLDICLVEDEPTLLATLEDVLQEAGHEVRACTDGDQAMERIQRERFDVLISDVRLPGEDGYALARSALDKNPPIQVVLMTAYAEVNRAVEMLKLGVCDYLTKPFEEARLLAIISSLEQELGASPACSGAPVAVAPVMIDLLRMVTRVARSDVTVLLTGETGVGKEVIARELHKASPRAAGPFIAANCAAIPNELVESELFGYRKGAFTGASSSRQGWIRSAEGGTLFLDEVSELSHSAQARLLRAVETHEVLPVGSDRPITVDFRILAATNKNLRNASSDGSFREDLMYRLAAFELNIPPLRARCEDIGPLITHFLDCLRARAVDVPKRFNEDALAVMMAHPWPGNVRELRNAVEHAAVLAGASNVSPSHLPGHIRTGPLQGPPLGLREALGRVEEEQIRRALAVTGGGRARTADLLGISRKHLWDLMRRHDISG